MITSLVKRESGIELLRIVLMLLIMNLHSFFSLEILTWSDVSLGVAFDYFRESLGICAVNAFVLISGYFSIRLKPKSVLSLIFQIYFWILLVYAGLLVVGKLDFRPRDLFARLNCLFNSYGFIWRYLVLMLLSPVLNAFVEKVDRKHLLYFIIIFFSVEAYAEFLKCPEFNGGYCVMHFCGLYLLGRWLNGCKHIGSWRAGGWYLLITVLIAIAALAYKIIGNVESSSFKMFMGMYNNPLIVLQSVMLFMCFRDMHFSNKSVNWVSGSVLAIYLLHMHPDLKHYYYDYTHSLYNLSCFEHIWKLALLIFAVFVVAIFIDKIRVFLFDKLYPYVIRLINKIFGSSWS